MTITARFDSKCPACSRWIHAGDSVEWTKGSKARHTDCEAASPEAQQARYADALAVIETNAKAYRASHPEWVATLTPITLDSMADNYREGRTAIHVYEDERTARAHEALNEGWDGEYRIRPINDNDYLPNKPVITYASLLPALQQAHMLEMLYIVSRDDETVEVSTVFDEAIDVARDLKREHPASHIVVEAEAFPFATPDIIWEHENGSPTQDC